ncbi:uncharacterized protein K460DRAFT_23485 [Cucurbitaria berberidis CBS 394.84]|uniref:Uncharacterized protein n=1 Tax=Cucurbitaria berberidis CBS 394.84 TaxID=1168544 RepID=A0A9P4GQR9_9PLEO|nr:uncharacterized protein K460DRAFT_23485 [Cucurbitaria berberidis CBS 394.84]KAF1850888.1 hypothetical protein K460DRAFT_23485 [Cucurbitaria berberidis CBS 394.84]
MAQWLFRPSLRSTALQSLARTRGLPDAGASLPFVRSVFLDEATSQPFTKGVNRDWMLQEDLEDGRYEHNPCSPDADMQMPS